MNLPGSAFILLSVACIGAAGMLNKYGQPQSVHGQMALMDTKDCTVGGFDTDAGHIGCLQPVSHGFVQGSLTEFKRYFGFDAAN